MALDPRFKAVAFDMDGTFMDTTVDYVKLLNVVFDEMITSGVPESAIIRSGGALSELKSGLEWLSKNGRQKDVDVIFGRISDRTTKIEMENADTSKPFDGAIEVLDLLKNKGYKTGILTRGGRSYAEYVLKRSNVWHMFDAVIARDDFPESEAKPSPMAMVNLGNAMGLKAEEILFLGDHQTDWLTARDSGAGFYGVLSGGFSMTDWKKTGNNIAVLNTVKDLLEII
jgi:Predicted phosphatases